MLTGDITKVTLENIKDITNNTTSKSINYKQNAIFVARDGAEAPANGLSVSNFPNPVLESTIVDINIPEEGFVSVDLYSVEGVRIAQIANGNFEKGITSFNFSSKNIASGTYQLVMRFGGRMVSSVMTVVK